jgi:cation diffusion facilitator family transporter
MLLALAQILQQSWSRWQSDVVPDVTSLSFLVMGATLIVNLVVTLWERRAGQRLNSSILLADARHTLSDVFVTISVIGGLIVVRLGYAWADPLLALVVAVVIAWGAWAIVRDAALSLTDEAAVAAPDVESAARSVQGVEGVHNIRTRGGDGMVWVDLHIQVDPDLRVDRAHEIASNVAERVEHEIGDTADVTVHVEPADPSHLKPERGFRPGS